MIATGPNAMGMGYKLVKSLIVMPLSRGLMGLWLT